MNFLLSISILITKKRVYGFMGLFIYRRGADVHSRTPACSRVNIVQRCMYYEWLLIGEVDICPVIGGHTAQGIKMPAVQFGVDQVTVG